MSKKAKDEKNRWRNKTVAFRMSPEEAEQLDIKVATSGLPKQEYLIKRVLQNEIVVLPNPRMQKALRDNLERVASELTRLSTIDPSCDILETINYIAKIIDRLSEKEKSSYPAR